MRTNYVFVDYENVKANDLRELRRSLARLSRGLEEQPFQPMSILIWLLRRHKRNRLQLRECETEGTQLHAQCEVF